MVSNIRGVMLLFLTAVMCLRVPLPVAPLSLTQMKHFICESDGSDVTPEGERNDKGFTG